MRVIKSVDYFETDMDPTWVAHVDPKPMKQYRARDPYVVEDDYMTKEAVHGKRFINQQGDLVVIGLTKEAAKVIGLPFEVIENQEQKLASLQQGARGLQKEVVRQLGEITKHLVKNRNLQNQLLKIQELNLRGRIKFLFTKRLP